MKSGIKGEMNNTFFIGWFVGFAAFFVIINVFSENSVPYNKGMLDCKLKPKKCELIYKSYLLEKQIKDINQKLPKTNYE